MKNFFRNYSLTSLVIVCIAAATIFLAYRTILIRGITMLAETSSVTTARITLHPIRLDLARYLEEANKPGRDPESVSLPVELDDAIEEVMRDSRVVRVKIYNHDGIVFFSTDPRQIGDHKSENPGFISAMAGKVAVKLVYRDHFNAFDQSTESDNLVQTYLPVRSRSTGPVIGVFETYTDVNALVMVSEQSEVLIGSLTILVLGAMYAALLMFVLRSNYLIENQQRTISEKSELLEKLSHQNMAREAMERKRLATDLHEGLAQTLGAVKLLLENAPAGAAAGKSDTVKSIIPILQNAISQTRAIAVDLSPPSLDDLGLGATLRGLRSEFEHANPSIHIDLQMLVPDSEIPSALKIFVYRVVEAVLKILDAHPNAGRVQIRLERDAEALVLLMQDDARILVQALSMTDAGADKGALASVVHERVIISGGRLAVVRNADDREVLRATWSLQTQVTSLLK